MYEEIPSENCLGNVSIDRRMRPFQTIVGQPYAERVQSDEISASNQVNRSHCGQHAARQSFDQLFTRGVTSYTFDELISLFDLIANTSREEFSLLVQISPPINMPFSQLIVQMQHTRRVFEQIERLCTSPNSMTDNDRIPGRGRQNSSKKSFCLAASLGATKPKLH